MAHKGHEAALVPLLSVGQPVNQSADQSGLSVGLLATSSRAQLLSASCELVELPHKV